MFHILANRLWIWSPVLLFQNQLPSFLLFSFATATTQLAIGEIDEEIGILLHCYLVVEGEILTEFEGCKAVDGNLLRWDGIPPHAKMEQHAVAAHAGKMSINSAWINLQVLGDLSVGHAADSFHKDFLVEVGALLPIGCAEGLCTEGDTAALARIPLDTAAINNPSEESCFFEGESFR